MTIDQALTAIEARCNEHPATPKDILARLDDQEQTIRRMLKALRHVYGRLDFITDGKGMDSTLTKILEGRAHE